MIRDERGLSELEEAFELEMDDGYGEDGMESEADGMDGDPDEGEYESDDGEPDARFQDEPDGGSEEGYAERLYELSQREFDSEEDAQAALDGVMREMYAEHFLGLGKVGRFLKKKAKTLAAKGIRHLAKKVPGFNLVRNVVAGKNLTQLLGTLGQGLLAGTPVGAGLGILNAITKGSDSEQRRGWEEYVEVCREAYDALADRLNEQSDEPVEASRQAVAALDQALRRSRERSRAGGGELGATRVIRLRPGERVVILAPRG